MADFVIQSNAQSVLLNGLLENTEDLSYEVPASFPLISKQIRELPSNNTISGAPAGQEVVFNVNRSMLSRNMMIESLLTVGTANTTNTTPGLDLFEWIEIRTNNKTIFRFSDAYLRARTLDSSMEKSMAIHRRAMALNPTTEDVDGTLTTFKTYTPIFCSWFEQVRTALDFSFYEQVQVACKFNTAARSGITNAYTAATCSLWTWTYRMDDKHYHQLKAKNQRPDGLLNMLTYNSFLEKQTCTSTTSNQIRFNSNYPVFKTHFFMRDNRTTGSGALTNIESISLSLGGTYLMENVTAMVGKYESECAGGSGIVATSETAISRSADNVWTLNWGLLPMDRTMNSGAISFAQINTPILTLNTAAITAANIDIYVVHEFWQIVSFNSNNGTVSISVQN